ARVSRALREPKLSQRSWQCAPCRAHHDRAYNATKNILAQALRLATLEAGHPEEAGKRSTASAVDSAETIGRRPGLDPTNRELIVRREGPSRRQTRRDRAKPAAA